MITLHDLGAGTWLRAPVDGSLVSTCGTFPRVSIHQAEAGAPPAYRVDGVSVDTAEHVVDVLNGKRALGYCTYCRITDIMGEETQPPYIRCTIKLCPGITPQHIPRDQDTGQPMRL